VKLAALALVLLSGCANKPEVVQVPVPCAAELPVQPAVYDDAEIVAMPEGRMLLALHADRKALRVYAGELEAVVKACQR
jgi:hypothetical protein